MPCVPLGTIPPFVPDETVVSKHRRQTGEDEGFGIRELCNDAASVGLICLLAALLLAYAVSYLVLSRRGYAEARKVQGEGFYYLPPEITASWRRSEGALRLLYLPLNLIDQGLGTGRVPSSEPLWDLS